MSKFFYGAVIVQLFFLVGCDVFMRHKEEIRPIVHEVVDEEMDGAK